MVASALWGALRPADRIPPYRLHVCCAARRHRPARADLAEVLPDVLADAAGADGVVVDLRSPGYQATGMPPGSAIER